MNHLRMNIKKIGAYIAGRIKFIFLYICLLIFLIYHTCYSVFSIITGKRLKRIDLE